MRTQEISLPHSYWGPLSPEDKTEFMRLRANFLQGQKISSKDRRIVTFRKELVSVLKYIERSDTHKEERSVLVGVCFAGPFICVNTRQLKNFLGRCKSSINGSFQQMGYSALRTKAKARACVVAVMPSLQNEQNILRQWTVRCASNDAQFCFISSFSHADLPTITEDDLYDEKKPTSQNGMGSPSMGSPLGYMPQMPVSQAQHFQPMQMQFQYQQAMMQRTQQMQAMMQQQQMMNVAAAATTTLQPPSQPPQQQAFVPQQQRPVLPQKPRMIEFDLPNIDEMDSLDPDARPRADLTSSMSVDSFHAYATDSWDDEPLGNYVTSFDWDSDLPAAPTPSAPKMTHSASAFLPSYRDWDLFDEY